MNENLKIRAFDYANQLEKRILKKEKLSKIRSNATLFI